MTTSAIARSTQANAHLCAEKLNYIAIQEELEGHSVRGKLLLMQALRWVKNTLEQDTNISKNHFKPNPYLL